MGDRRPGIVRRSPRYLDYIDHIKGQFNVEYMLTVERMEEVFVGTSGIIDPGRCERRTHSVSRTVQHRVYPNTALPRHTPL